MNRTLQIRHDLRPISGRRRLVARVSTAGLSGTVKRNSDVLVMFYSEA
jgi:hypothetical protein